MKRILLIIFMVVFSTSGSIPALLAGSSLLFNATISGEDIVCEDSEHEYTTESGMTGYEWEVIGGTITSGSGTGTIKIKWDLPQGQTPPYKVEVSYTDGNGDTQEGELVVSVNPIVIPTFGSFGPYCEGETPNPLPLTSTNGIVGTWSPSAINTAIVGTSNYTFTPDATLYPCAEQVEISVTVNPIVVPTFTSFGPYCHNATPNPLPITSTNGIVGTWSPSAINTAIVGTSNYTFTPNANLYPCAEQATISVTVKPIPSVSISGDTELCVGANTTLTANASGGSGSYSYNWSTGAMSSSIITPIFSIPTSIIYGVTVTSDGCPRSSNVDVNVAQQPTVTIIGDNCICKGDNFSLQAFTSGGIGTKTFSWEYNNNGVWTGITNSNSNSLVGQIIEDTDFRVTFKTAGKGCFEDISVPIEVKIVAPAPEIVGPDEDVCPGQVILFQASNLVSSDNSCLNESSISWSIPGAIPNGDSTEIGDYLFVKWPGNLSSGNIGLTETIGIDGSNCIGSDSFEVNAAQGSARPSADIVHVTTNHFLIVKDSSASCYQWGYIDLANNVIAELPGENFQAYAAGDAYNPNFVYWVKTWDGDCSEPKCATLSFRMLNGFNPIPVEEKSFSLFPNPNAGEFFLEAHLLDKEETYKLIISDAWGRILENRTVRAGTGSIKEFVSISSIAADGFYSATLWNSRGVYRSIRFIIAR